MPVAVLRIWANCCSFLKSSFFDCLGSSERSSTDKSSWDVQRALKLATVSLSTQLWMTRCLAKSRMLPKSQLKYFAAQSRMMSEHNLWSPRSLSVADIWLGVWSSNNCSHVEEERSKEEEEVAEAGVSRAGFSCIKKRSHWSHRNVIWHKLLSPLLDS